MSDRTKSPLDGEISRLTRRIDELLVAMEQLREENRALKQRHESLAGERASLLQKNEQVRARVEAMIGRLKALEHGA
jgi:cell division protein ZapB